MEENKSQKIKNEEQEKKVDEVEKSKKRIQKLLLSVTTIPALFRKPSFQNLDTNYEVPYRVVFLHSPVTAFL